VVIFERIFVPYLALEVIGALLSAIGYGPRLFVVIEVIARWTRDARRRRLPAVVKMSSTPNCRGELVLVGRDVGAVHGDRGIAIRDFQVAENLS